MEKKFIEIAQKIIKETKEGETRVYFRLFPIRGLAFDTANLPFFNQVLSSAYQGVKSPIFLGCVTIEYFPIFYPVHDVCLHEGLSQENINLCKRTISGNFLMLGCPYIKAESEAVLKIETVTAILRLSFGNFIAWPRFYEFMINVAPNKEPNLWFPQRTQRIYDPHVDGPFIGNKEKNELEIDIKAIITYVIKNNNKFALPLSLIEDAAKEENVRKKLFLYFSAIQIMSDTEDLKQLINFMIKHYKKNKSDWDYFKEALLLKPVTLLRHDVIHRGYNPKSFPILERYLQILCLEILECRLGIEPRNLLEKFINFYGTTWWLDKKLKTNQPSF